MSGGGARGRGAERGMTAGRVAALMACGPVGVDATMAFVGTRAVFEKAGFRKLADTSAVVGGFPRVLMQRELR